MASSNLVYEYDPFISGLVLMGSGGLAFIGLVFNVLLMWVLWRIGELWGSFSFRLITCVAIGDIVTSMATLGIGLFRSKLGYDGVIESLWYCRVFGFHLFYGHNLSGILISMIALDRYLVVRHRTRLSPLYSWLVFGIVALLYAATLGINSYQNTFKMDLTHSFCLPAGKPVSKAAEIFSTILFNLPLLVLCFCYITIFFVCRRLHSSNKYINHRLPFRALVCMFAYLLCYLPKLINTIWYMFRNAYPTITFCILAIYGLNSTMAINPILVVFLNNQVRQEIITMYISPRCRN
ncbi:G-protein coupled receptor 35 [Entomophthora muscae]|uniref:G-protein coupled receptor 35 n=1 Tax=Entomophthora muscae TaxID=34485 RepID=A0ACC2SLU8_9FUNG|nr:G-protein coupled receptor 35 [Entomophthora muscae]